MPYTLKWLVANRILHLYVSSDVPIQMWGEIQAAIYTHVAEGMASVHLIVEAELNPNVKTISDIKNLSGLRPIVHPNMGWIMILQRNIMVRLFATVALQLYSPQVNYEMVSDYDHAVAALKHRDESLRALHIPKIMPENAMTL
ncbi:MAG: hypothetical protein SGI73_15815 [Chloroflexota bacterium]|nr:hypothetical protein [Chloroflexota bacterium]